MGMTSEGTGVMECPGRGSRQNPEDSQHLRNSCRRGDRRSSQGERWLMRHGSQEGRRACTLRTVSSAVLGTCGCCGITEGWVSREARLVKEQPEDCIPSPFQAQALPQGRDFSVQCTEPPASPHVGNAPQQRCPSRNEPVQPMTPREECLGARRRPSGAHRLSHRAFSLALPKGQPPDMDQPPPPHPGSSS